MIFVNFKTYPQGSGEKAVELAKLCEKVSEKTGVEIIPIVQLVDLYRVVQAVKIPVWVQHVDLPSRGPYTGWINIETVIGAGATGTLLNHSEHQLPFGTVNQILKRCKVLSPRSLKVMVCGKTIGQAERLAKLKPGLLAYEPSELIGNKEKSVATERPKAIKKIVEISKIPVIVGAGIHSKQDVKISLQMGAKGVLVATNVVLADDPEKALTSLAEGFK